MEPFCAICYHYGAERCPNHARYTKGNLELLMHMRQLSQEEDQRKNKIIQEYLQSAEFKSKYIKKSKVRKALGL